MRAPRIDVDEHACWRRSSYSNQDGGNCVEWVPTYAVVHGAVPVRDSKVPGGPVLTVSTGAWSCFVDFARGSA
ncbi:DUF397 domain-containing protein [Streptomyces spectabilis]|uniref:DUF397 domain-containing protein n=1 Tax=Streptomyces spectabilis TaxID=68270 RepID=UPI0033D4B582